MKLSVRVCQAVTEKCQAVVYELRSFAGLGVEFWKCSGDLIIIIFLRLFQVIKSFGQMHFNFAT